MKITKNLLNSLKLKLIKIIMSFILSSLARKKIVGWNYRVFTEDDFYNICGKEKIRITESPIKSRGEYVIYKNVSFIILRTNLKSTWRTWVCWHELAHHFLHSPGHYLFNHSTARKVDFEANFVSSVALIPTKLVENLTLSEIAEEYNYPLRLIDFRKQIYDYYKI